jgi:DNA-binding MarR family transcriptional regulator
MPVLWASLSDLQRRVLLLLGKADGYPLMEQIIGQRFSLTRYETKEAIERLEELNLVGKLTNGDLVAFDLTRDGRKLYLDVTKVPQPSLPIETRVAASPVSSAAVERTADEEWDQLTENQRRVLTCLAKADGQAVDEREIAGKCELSNLRTAQELGGLEQLGVVKRHRQFAYGNYVSAELTPVGVRLVLAKGIEAVNSRANRRGPHR